MTLLWCLAGASLVLALVAWAKARRTAKQLAQLSEMVWEQRYQHGELKLRVQRMSGEMPSAPPPPQAPGLGEPAEAFVPLSSLGSHRAGVRGPNPAEKR
jgi:hypothetical protein